MPGPSARLLALLSLLQSRRDWPGSVLAERLEVSERTVRRDVERLREMGYPVGAAKGPDGGYRLAAGAELPPLLFDDEQAVAIAVALRLMAASGVVVSGVGIEEAAMRALATVRQVMPARLRHRVDALKVTALGRATDPFVARVDIEQLVALTNAARDGESVRFDYEPSFPSEQEPSLAPPRRAEPHHIVSRHGRWYLVAWDLDRADWRTFRLDRMRLRVPNGARFRPRELPDGMSVDAFVSATFKGGADLRRMAVSRPRGAAPTGRAGSSSRASGHRGTSGSRKVPDQRGLVVLGRCGSHARPVRRRSGAGRTG